MKRRAPTGRSIPACTGEPILGGRPDGPPETTGLSPRVRGNPLGRRASRGKLMVYPRVYGGTGIRPRRSGLSASRGLSPRVRGNLGSSTTAQVRVGSIPACTGEPPPRTHAKPSATVYPRVYGGTIAIPADDGEVRGLSPRVRGNRSSVSWVCSQGWSIPACTGEPTRTGSPRSYWRRVYPRVYGGTAWPTS